MNRELKTSTSLLILVFVVLGVYYPAIFAPLNSVDDPGMYSYLLNTENFTLKGIFVPGGSGSYYRPLLVASFWADKYVWGLQESFMHLENMLFHLGNTLLVFAIARAISVQRGARSAVVPLAAALFFAIHPINTEAVNWISGRTDLLAGFFLLLSTLILLLRPLGPLTSLAAAVSMLAGCLVKETSLFFLPAALLFPFFSDCEPGVSIPLRLLCRRHASHFLLFLTAGTGYLMFRKLAFNQGDQGVTRVLTHVTGDQSFGLLLSLKLVLKSLGFYTKKLVVPFPLNFGIMHVSNAYVVLGILAGVAIALLLVRRTLPGFFFVCAASVGCSGLMIPLLRVTWTPLAERYLYIPAAFFLIGTTLALQKWAPASRHRTATVVLLGVLATIALIGTTRRNLLWQDNFALYQDTFRKSPDFLPARNEMANELCVRGKNREANALYQAFKDDGTVINAQYGLVNIAFALTQEGKFDEARGVLRKALEKPGKHEVMILKRMLEVNKIQVMQKKVLSAAVYSDNVRVLSRLIEITGDPFYRYRLGVVELQDGDRERARQAFALAARAEGLDAGCRSAAQKLSTRLATTSPK